LKRNPGRSYLGGNLNVAKMHRYVIIIVCKQFTFIRNYVLLNNPIVPYTYYYRVFAAEFGNKLGFAPPKTDCCNTCVTFEMEMKQARKDHNDAELTRIVDAHRNHLKTAANRRDCMNIDFGGRDVEDILLDHTTIVYDDNGQIQQEPLADYIIYKF